MCRLWRTRACLLAGSAAGFLACLAPYAALSFRSLRHGGGESAALDTLGGLLFFFAALGAFAHLVEVLLALQQWIGGGCGGFCRGCRGRSDCGGACAEIKRREESPPCCC